MFFVFTTQSGRQAPTQERTPRRRPCGLQQRRKEDEKTGGLRDLGIGAARVDPDRRRDAEKERRPGRLAPLIPQAEDHPEEERGDRGAEHEGTEPRCDGHELGPASRRQRGERRRQRRARNVYQHRQQGRHRIEPAIGTGRGVHGPGTIDRKRPMAHQILSRLPHRDGIAERRAPSARQQIEAEERHEHVGSLQDPRARRARQARQARILRRREAKPQAATIPLGGSSGAAARPAGRRGFGSPKAVRPTCGREPRPAPRPPSPESPRR